MHGPLNVKLYHFPVFIRSRSRSGQLHAPFSLFPFNQESETSGEVGNRKFLQYKWRWFKDISVRSGFTNAQRSTIPNKRSDQVNMCKIRGAGPVSATDNHTASLSRNVIEIHQRVHRSLILTFIRSSWIISTSSHKKIHFCRKKRGFVNECRTNS
jgi:hypothetical protein